MTTEQQPNPEQWPNPEQRPKTHKAPAASAWIEWGLIGVAGVSVAAAIAHAFYPERVTQTTALFLGLAAATLIIREVSKLEFGGFKLERVRQELKQDIHQVDQKVDAQVEQVEKKIDVIETSGVLPGRTGPARRTRVRPAGAAPDPNDPHKGQFGGLPEANGRLMRATILPIAGPSSAACRVQVVVESTDPAKKPLQGKVTFYLHPTFGEVKRTVQVQGGWAEISFTAWGAFTIGAEADEGQTKLELDLMYVDGGTDKFYGR